MTRDPKAWTWHTKRYGKTVVEIGTRFVAYIHPTPAGETADKTEIEALAALIASAPKLADDCEELLEALRGLVAGIEGAAAAGIDSSGYVGLGAALAAIAKAEGR